MHNTKCQFTNGLEHACGKSPLLMHWIYHTLLVSHRNIIFQTNTYIVVEEFLAIHSHLLPVHPAALSRCRWWRWRQSCCTWEAGLLVLRQHPGHWASLRERRCQCCSLRGRRCWSYCSLKGGRCRNRCSWEGQGYRLPVGESMVEEQPVQWRHEWWDSAGWGNLCLWLVCDQVLAGQGGSWWQILDPQQRVLCWPLLHFHRGQIHFQHQMTERIRWRCPTLRYEKDYIWLQWRHIWAS